MASEAAVLAHRRRAKGGPPTVDRSPIVALHGALHGGAVASVLGWCTASASSCLDGALPLHRACLDGALPLHRAAWSSHPPVLSHPPAQPTGRIELVIGELVGERGPTDLSLSLRGGEGVARWPLESSGHRPVEHGVVCVDEAVIGDVGRQPDPGWPALRAMGTK